MRCVRIGVSTPKRTASRATSRNYMRRVIHEIVRGELHRVIGADLVIRVKAAFYPGEFAAIRTELADAIGIAWRRCPGCS